MNKIISLDDEIGEFSKRYMTLYNQLKSHIDQQTKASAKTSAINKELNIAHDIQMGLLKKPQLNQSNIRRL